MTRIGARARARARERLYYGWVLVTALALTEMTSWGVLYYAFAVFVKPMQADLGSSRAAIAGAFSVALLVSGAAAVPVGRWLDRHGARLLMTAGSCLAVVLVLAWSSVRGLAALYLVWAGIGLAMAAVLYEPAFAVVAAWFRRKRGRALTLLTFVAGFASVIYVPLAGWLVARQGWREALVTLAVILAAGTIPLHALALRRHPRDLGLAVDGAEPAVAALDAGGADGSRTLRTALHHSGFWLLTGAFFLNALGVGAVFVHLVPYLSDRGYGAEFAAGITGVIGLMALPGRLVLTPLGDRLPRRAVAAGIFLLQTAALVLLLVLPGIAGVAGFVILFGAGFGAVTPARAALVADAYGPAHYGSINGAVALFLTGARALAPIAAGLVRDLAGSYTPAFWALAVLSALSAVLILLADRGRT